MEFNYWTGEFTKTLTGHTNTVRALIKISDNLLASGSEDTTILIWDLNQVLKAISNYLKVQIVWLICFILFAIIV